MCFLQQIVYVLKSMMTSKRQRSLEPLAAWMFSHICGLRRAAPRLRPAMAMLRPQRIV